MKKRSAGRLVLASGVFASTWLAATVGGIGPDRVASAIDVARQAAPAPTSIGAPFDMPPLASFAEINERPLFAPDRRPHKVPVPLVAPGTPVILTGIVILPEGRYAMIRDGGSKTVRVAEGDRIASGTIKRILHDRIEIAIADEGETIVKLFAPDMAKSGIDHAPPSVDRLAPRTRRPIARSTPPGPDGGFGNHVEPPNDAPPRSG
jgi:hypothetical protein